MEYNKNVNTKRNTTWVTFYAYHMKKKGIFHALENFENAPVFF